MIKELGTPEFLGEVVYGSTDRDYVTWERHVAGGKKKRYRESVEPRPHKKKHSILLSIIISE